MKNYLLILLAFLATGIVVSCGKGDSASSAPQPTQAPEIRALSPGERAHYCFLDVNLDSDQGQSDYVSQIQGTWVHQAQGADESSEFTRREFMLDSSRKIVAVTTYQDYSHDVEDITYKKICVGQPLDAGYGEYAGFRTVELMAAGNEGAAAVLVKFESSGTNMTLTVSDRFYVRYNDTTGVLNLHRALSTGVFKKLWVYPVRQ